MDIIHVITHIITPIAFAGIRNRNGDSVVLDCDCVFSVSINDCRDASSGFFTYISKTSQIVTLIIMLINLR